MPGNKKHCCLPPPQANKRTILNSWAVPPRAAEALISFTFFQGIAFYIVCYAPSTGNEPIHNTHHGTDEQIFDNGPGIASGDGVYSGLERNQ